jgi:hypothetical protein
VNAATNAAAIRASVVPSVAVPPANAERKMKMDEGTMVIVMLTAFIIMLSLGVTLWSNFFF